MKSNNFDFILILHCHNDILPATLGWIKLGVIFSIEKKFTVSCECRILRHEPSVFVAN